MIQICRHGTAVIALFWTDCPADWLFFVAVHRCQISDLQLLDWIIIGVLKAHIAASVQEHNSELIPKVALNKRPFGRFVPKPKDAPNQKFIGSFKGV